MRALIRNTAIYAFSLSLFPQLFAGVNISGGLTTILAAGLLLTILFWILRPILNILLLPLNILTFGAFSFITNVVIVYLLTVFLPRISIEAFIFPGASFTGFVIPRIEFNTFFAYIVVTVVFSAIVSGIQWLIDK